MGSVQDMEHGLERPVQRLSELRSLDGPAVTIQRAVGKAVPHTSRLKELLSGAWLGHPLHPVLTDVVVGTWTSAFLLDLIPTRATRKAADRLIGAGCLAALPTAAAGLTDWLGLGGEERRIGLVHGGGNVVALLLQTRSWVSRKRGRRARGWLLSAAAMGIATGTAYLGGHLTYSRGVGVGGPPRGRADRVVRESSLPTP
jgi:uncharacterized membrane protein